MKLKCPGCSKVLQVPDSAAGKVVRCQCGKQMRVPGGSVSASPSKGRSTAAATGSRRSQAAPQGGGPGELDPGLFDELTEDDWRPVAAPRSGSAPAPTSSGGGTLFKQYAPPEEVDEAKKAGKQPGLLVFLGVINGIWAILYMLGTLAILGLVAMIPAIGAAGEMEEGDGVLLTLAIGVLIFATVLSIATSVSCFVSNPICWYIVLFSYAFACGERLITVVDAIGAGNETSEVIGAVVALVIGFMFLAYLHGGAVRDFYRTGKHTLGTIATADGLGVLLGLGLTYAVALLPE